MYRMQNTMFQTQNCLVPSDVEIETNRRFGALNGALWKMCVTLR